MNKTDKQVMMSAFALCPTDMAHPDRMDWIAKYFRQNAADVSEAVGVRDRMSDELRTWIEGMSVSLDVSTGEDDADHRYYGVINEVMDCEGDKHGVTLLVYDAKPNFEVSTPAIAPEASELPPTDEATKDALRDLMYIGAALKKAGADEFMMNRLESVRSHLSTPAIAPEASELPPTDAKLDDHSERKPILQEVAQLLLNRYDELRTVKGASSAAEFELLRLALMDVPTDANNYHDAYRGARDDLQDWKRRALAAEELASKIADQYIKDNND